MQVLGYDPNLYEEEVNKFGVEYVKNLANLDKVDGIILATLHSQFKALSYAEFLQYYNGNGRGVFVDIKSYFLKEARIQKDVIYKSL